MGLDTPQITFDTQEALAALAAIVAIAGCFAMLAAAFPSIDASVEIPRRVRIALAIAGAACFLVGLPLAIGLD